VTASSRGRTRIAPTPSGYLHAGNVATFRATADLAAHHDLDLALRIDDADAARYRTDYAADIFRVLDLLDIHWQIGPRDVTDFETAWSQRLKTHLYRAELNRFRDSTSTYACACSRRDLAGIPEGGCPGRCWERHLELIPDETSLRVRVPLGTIITVGDVAVDIAAAIGDAVLWRRDDLPAYHLVTIVEDRDLGTTHIVRGADLLTSSAFHMWLAPHLGAQTVADATYVHLPLVTGPDGAKLSKSQRGDHARPWTLSS
jgi:glutamyl-tRNA synthetase